MRLRLALVLLSATALVAATGVDASAGGVAPSTDTNVGTQQVLFRSGTAGYGCFRIPALVKTAAGNLLAFAEGRASPSCADRGDIDLVMRRSTNNGRTWGPIRVVLSGSDTDGSTPFTRGNPAPVVDGTTGQIFLLSTSNPATPGGKRLPWIQESGDDGVTWSTAKALGISFDQTTNGWFATGPMHGIQLQHGPHAGRLVVGAHQVPDGSTVYAGALYSDNDGASWQASQVPNSYVKDTLNPGEVSVAELPDGSVYASARNDITSGDHRAQAVSADGGDTVPAFTPVPSLITPSVEGSVLALRSTYQSQAGDTLIFSGPADPASRRQLTIRYSTDNGTTWQTPAGGLISSEYAGYSDLAELADGEIGLLYEGGTFTDELGNKGYSADQIRFNRFTPASIGLPGTFTGTVLPQASPAAAPTSPDATAEANDAYLRGNATLGSGRFGQGLSLDGSGDYAEVPYSSTLNPGSGDFTYSTWFSYVANTSKPNQVLFWGYGVGAGKPQVWLRAQPSQDRLYAWVQGASGTASVALVDATSATAFGDGAWHHLSLVRAGTRITLTVDGAVSATANGVAGAIADTQQSGVEGLRLGAKPDAAASDPFTGSIDEFRLYRQALTSAQLDQVRTGNTTAPDAALALRLPFQVIDGATTATRVRVSIEDDLSGKCASGTLLGGQPTLTDRTATNTALVVDNAHPGVEVPFLPTLDLGSGDFSFTTMFRYSPSSTNANQVLLWAYGVGSGKRQIWIRAQPAQDRLYAWVQTDAGQVSVALPDVSNSTAFADGAWHKLALIRGGDQIALSVDGGTAAIATGLTGSVTAGAADGIEGLRVGSKLDGTEVWQGAVDEARLYHRALTAAELAGTPGSPALWWSFESGFTQTHNVMRPVPDGGPATPGSTVHCDNAYVRGGAAVNASGKFGSALKLDGIDGTVQLPYTPATDLGSGDFTICTWLKYSAASNADQVLLWAYGVGASERQIWIRAQPSKDWLYAAFETDVATTTVTAPDSSSGVAFGDNQWHHIALERSGGTLSLIVDGATMGSASVPAGSVTYPDAFAVDGFQLGAKPGGSDPLNGSLDEFRIFHKALSADELNSVRLNNTDLGTVTGVRLPFDVVTGGSYARM